MKVYVYYDDLEMWLYKQPHSNKEGRELLEIDTPENIKKTMKIAEKEGVKNNENWSSAWVKCEGVESELFNQIIKTIHKPKREEPTNQITELKRLDRYQPIKDSDIERLNEHFRGSEINR
jgi:hypothetical protein